MKVVYVLSRTLPHYRKKFFEITKVRLSALGVDLRVVYGQPSDVEGLKGDGAELTWGTKIQNRYLRFAGRDFCWQPALKTIADGDLVIVSQANRLLINYVLLFWQILGKKKLCLWGHGKNYQARSNSKSEWLKRKWSNNVHWWFAYNQESSHRVLDLGYPGERVTNVNNAVDTADLIALEKSLPEEEVRHLRQKLGIEGPCAVYIGGMYTEKRVDFLIAAARLVRKVIPNFSLVLVGGGNHLSLATAAAETDKWIHPVGPKFGRDLVLHAKLGSVMLMPGLVGLAILDCFALRLPMVTTSYPYHSPEISYMRDGFNGIIVKDWRNEQAYADAVVGLFQSPKLLASLVEGCEQDSLLYTIDNMSQNFAEGVLKALSAPRYKGF